ncbi:MAG TPA: MaoC family dehydratase N-terminal domain-containing protein [Acetobacteraceae bacterium]|nr:MaoC family dehydratase N-terminal domain-containing protein [Acetobacteraceae bacterium]
METIEHLRQWIGRRETAADTITPVPVAALSATLDRDDPPPTPGTVLPPLWHWLYFLPVHRQSEIGADGHAKRGGFLPPVSLPRRMWAGGRYVFHQDLHVGEAIARTSTIADVSMKEGQSGRLVFVLVRHEIAGESGLALTEEHDIVYREAPAPGAPPPAARPAPEDAAWRRRIVPDDVLLFRYSALTFNGHRIHYDRRYVTEVEGYPGLIVHGPLIATLLADLLRRHENRRLATFNFRAMSPLFDIAPFEVCGRPDGNKISLWARNAAGGLAMQADAVAGPA